MKRDMVELIDVAADPDNRMNDESVGNVLSTMKEVMALFEKTAARHGKNVARVAYDSMIFEYFSEMPCSIFNKMMSIIEEKHVEVRHPKEGPSSKDGCYVN